MGYVVPQQAFFVLHGKAAFHRRGSVSFQRASEVSNLPQPIIVAGVLRTAPVVALVVSRSGSNIQEEAWHIELHNMQGARPCERKSKIENKPAWISFFTCYGSAMRAGLNAAPRRTGPSPPRPSRRQAHLRGSAASATRETGKRAANVAMTDRCAIK